MAAPGRSDTIGGPALGVAAVGAAVDPPVPQMGQQGVGLRAGPTLDGRLHAVPDRASEPDRGEQPGQADAAEEPGIMGVPAQVQQLARADQLGPILQGLPGRARQHARMEINHHGPRSGAGGEDASQ